MSVVHVGGRQEGDAGMPMFVVVPGDEADAEVVAAASLLHETEVERGYRLQRVRR
jgi:hypothetical protein